MIERISAHVKIDPYMDAFGQEITRIRFKVQNNI